jgi:Na+/melibiose symporter-like transporter
MRLKARRMSIGFGALMPLWFRKSRRRLDGLLKNLGGKTLWVRRLVSGDTHEAQSRKYILVWNGAANIAANMAGGNFLVGLYTIINLSDVLLGVLTTMIQFCNVFQIMSPLLLGRFKQKKKILLITRIMYYSLYIVIIGIIPFVPGEDGLRTGILLAVMVAANFINALAAPGYSVLHIRSIPEESRADFFSVQSLLVNICVYVFILICGCLVDFFRNRGSFLAGIIAVRVVGLVFAALEIYAHCHVHEFDEPDGAEPHPRINPFAPLRNKEFMICVLLTGLYSCFANIPGVYYSSYLVHDLVVPFSYLGIVNFLSVPIMLFAVPVWNHVIRKLSWFKAISMSLLLASAHYFMLPFVGKENYLYLYTIAVIYYFMVIPGVSIVSANLPYYRLPEGGRTNFLAFYAGFNSFMTMLGLSCGSFFIGLSRSMDFTIFGWHIRNKQFIMMIAGTLLICLGIFYRHIAKREKRMKARADAEKAAAGPVPAEDLPAAST